MRDIVTRALAALLTAVLFVLLLSTTTFAAATATWHGNDLSYDGKTYTAYTVNNSGTHPPVVPQGETYYKNDQITDVINGSGRTAVIYFDSRGPPTTATSANLIVYNVNGDGKYGTVVSGPDKIAVTPKSQNSSSTKAVWNGPATLVFDGNSYKGDGTQPYVATNTSTPKLSAGVKYYQFIGSPDVSGTGLLHVIFFPANIDPTLATKATYATFRIDGDGNIGSQVGNNKSIDVTPLAQSPNGGVATSDESATTCAVPGGLGWIICPVTNFLAWGMDQIFNMLKGFLEVAPLSTDTTGPLYQAWNTIRSIANVAFVIVFLIIIYSQLTGSGMSNYGIKKLLPRLIVAAVLVNLSYYICAIAVDLSNIAGVGLQEILLDLRERLNTADGRVIPTWESIVPFILTNVTVGAAAAVGIGGIILTAGGSLGSALILLLPMLLGLIIAVLVALLVLAARQALIILLIIVAPLAFVAYLLPNTEKLFERWRGVFITMLVFFPLFALIFGGSQLAAFLIINSVDGDNPNALNVILLAMFVQVAPLVLTPLLVRFSGGLIGRIAGFVNNPSKGLIDRTRNWARSQSEFMAARNMARTDPVRRRQVFRRFALTGDRLRRSQEERLKAYKEGADARWTNSREYSNIQQQLRYNEDLKALGVDSAAERYETSKTTSATVRSLDTRVRDMKLRVENAKATGDLQWENNHSASIAEQRLRERVLKDSLAQVHSAHDAEYADFKAGRLGNYPANARVTAMMNQARIDNQMTELNRMRGESATRAIQEQFTRDLEANIRTANGQLMQTYAGGVQGIAGAQRALANAISTQSKTHAEAVANAATILAHGNYSDSVIGEIALGRNAGTRVVITDDMREAAISHIAGGANTGEILKLMRELDINPSAANQDFRQTFSEKLLANPNRPKMASAGTLDQAKQGYAPMPGKARIDRWNTETLNANKFASADTLVTQDREYLESLFDTLANNTSGLPISAAARANLRRAILQAQTEPQYSGRIGERADVLARILTRL